MPPCAGARCSPPAPCWPAAAGPAARAPPAPTPTAEPTGETTTLPPLLVYFSRPGENYYCGGRRDLEVGNTEVLARMISELIDGDVYRIEAADPYSAQLRRDRAAQRPRAGRRRTPRDRQPARLDQLVRHRADRQPDLERPPADDHDHVRREPRLHGQAASIPSSPTPSAAWAAPKPSTPPPFPVPRIGPGLAVQGEEVPSTAATCRPGFAEPA